MYQILSTTIEADMTQTGTLHRHLESTDAATPESLRDDGVYPTLLQRMLSLNPSECLSTLQQAVNSLARLTDGRFAS